MLIKKTLPLLLFVASTSVNAEMVFHRGNCAEPQSIDPQMTGDVQGGNILRDLFEGLIAEDINGEITPGIAKSWDISPDGLNYTFHLRDAIWSNNEPITASDFVYAWQRALNPETGNSYAFLLYPVKNAEAIAQGKEEDLTKLGISAIDNKTLKVTLKAPTPYFLSLLTHAISYPAPQKTIEAYGNAWTKPENIVSNGAFKMASWIPQASLTLVKSDKYWDHDNVKLDTIVFYPTDDRNAELRRFRAGEIDWTCDVPHGQFKFIHENFADQLKTSNRLGVYYYGFNTTKAPFKNNLPLRKALSLAINRDFLTDNVLKTGEKPAYNLVMEGVLNAKPYHPEYANWTQAKREALAQKLYQEAGYSKENPLSIEIRYNTSENHKKIAVAIAGMWKEILGVETTQVNEEWKVFLQNRKMKNTEVFRADWLGDYNDANTFLELFTTSAGKNEIGHYSSQFDAQLGQANQTQQLTERATMLHDAEKMLIDSFSLAPLYFYVNKHLISDKVKGYNLNVMNHSRSKYIWIEEDKKIKK